MPQLSYDFFQPVASVGLKADLKWDYVISCRAFETIAIGLGVAKVTGEDFTVRLPYANSSTIVFSADLVASNEINGEVNGVAITPVTFAVSHVNTMGLIAAAITAADPNVTATVGGSNNRTLFLTAANGFNSIVSNWVVTLGASQATTTLTNTTADVLYGIALRIQNKMNLMGPNGGSAGPSPYYEGDCISTETQGVVWVTSENGNTSDSPVYWRFITGGVGEVKGQFRTDADGGQAILIPSTIARWLTSASAGELAQLQIQLP